VVETWKVEAGEIVGIETVGVFLLWTGIMCDLPMRCKMYRNVQWNAYHPCEQCGIRGEIEKVDGRTTSGMKVTGWAHVLIKFDTGIMPLAGYRASTPSAPALRWLAVVVVHDLCSSCHA
jgi:hypothetical protein